MLISLSNLTEKLSIKEVIIWLVKEKVRERVKAERMESKQSI